MADRTKSNDLEWAKPVMRAGYAGRGMIYVIVSALSLLTVWRGGTPGGTSDALQAIETHPAGVAALSLTALGLMAYAVWRIVAAAWDLEDHGTGMKGDVARFAQAVTGIIHLGVAVGVVTVIIAAGVSNGDQSTIEQGTAWLMGMPFGRILVGVVGAVLLAAGGYYLHKGIKQKYMEYLPARGFTLKLRPALTVGLVAQGTVVAIIGGLLIIAAWRADPNEAGGLGAAFSWLRDQAYGKALVTALALGLFAFAVFCFVNAAFRIVPKLRGRDIETLRQKLGTITR